MTHENFFSIICYLYFYIQLVGAARKYDIESEAIRLYGEDFKSVLSKFRRTPDYLQILEEKYNEMTIFFSEIATYAMQHTMDNRLKRRVADACGYDDAIQTTTHAYYYKAHGRRQDPPEAPEEPTPPRPDHDAHDSPKTSKNPIDLLEHYSHFKNILTVQERNNMRNLAFEVTGQMIHMMIQSMGPVEGPVRSTRLPFGGEAGEVETTTEKDHRHTIGTTEKWCDPKLMRRESSIITKALMDDPSTSTTNEPDTNPETYRFRYKSHNV